MSKCIFQKKKSVFAILMATLFSVTGVKNVYAQTQVAMLKHGEEISAFYGTNALREAHEAAETGDIITLSSGAFTLDSITKAITLHGAGIISDSIAGSSATVITSYVTAYITNEGVLTVEGITFTNTFTGRLMSNPHFVKCYFNNFITSNASNCNVSSPQFVNCRFRSITLTNKCSDSCFINCILWSIASSGSGMVANNSFINIGGTGNCINGFNCVFIGNPNACWLGGDSSAFNCIGIGVYHGFDQAYNENCWVFDSVSDVFESYTGNDVSYLTEPLFLKEEIASSCLGTDGTQVGIHGGMIPYSDRPYYMTIKRCTVGDRTTDDGHLSVDIEVVTEE